MLCRKRQQVHREVLAFIGTYGGSEARRHMQVSSDWINDLWYMWLARGGKARVNEGYMNFADFCHLFEICLQQRVRSDTYVIPLLDVARYLWRGRSKKRNDDGLAKKKSE